MIDAPDSTSVETKSDRKEWKSARPSSVWEGMPAAARSALIARAVS
ncbi:MAG: hypothetical protein SFX72_02990 [Isosphaeraceae bacterium]|nr:hypothetical protein [Isosphaeraceae bacterium]